MSAPSLAASDGKAKIEHSDIASLETQGVGRDKVWERRTQRLIDFRLLVVLGLCFTASVVDRTNIGAARVAGMQQALRLDIGDRYSIISLVFFVPYIMLELPSNIVLKKVGARNWLAFLTVSFGAVTLAMGFCKDWRTMVICRVLLGALEAGFFPACVYLISCWYTRYMMQSRLAMFYLLSIMVSGFSGALGYGISLLDGKGGLEGWSWIFLIFGLTTIVFGIGAYFFCVDFPDKSNFLDPEQQAWVIMRLNADRGDALPDKMTFKAVLVGFSDFRVWLYAVCFGSATTGAYAFNFFLPTILSSWGFSRKLSLLLSAPPYAFTAIYIYVVSVAADRYKTRGPFIVFSSTMCLIGLLLLGYAKGNAVRFFGAFITIAGCQANIPTVTAWSQNNVTQHTRRAVTSAVVIGFGGIGGIIASTVFRQQDYPGYRPGLWVVIGTQLVTIAVVCGLALHSRRMNAKVDRGEAVIQDTPGFKYTF